MPLMSLRWVGELAHHMGLGPLLWIAVLHVRGVRPGVEWWWLATAFGVSWLADTASHWTGHPFVGALYPVSQAALIGAVFLTRREAVQFVTVLAIVAIVNLLWHGVAHPEVFLRTVAWGAVVGVVFDRWALGRLRTALLVTFGLGLVAWWGYALWPGWASWLTYQSVRLAGIVLFCLAATRPGPQLRLERGRE